MLLLKGETPLDLAYRSQSRHMVYMVKEEEKIRSRRNSRLLKIVEKYEVISGVIMNGNKATAFCV